MPAEKRGDRLGLCHLILSLSEKAINVSRRLHQRTLSLQVRTGRGDLLTIGSENRNLIAVIALVVKFKPVSVIAMCAGCHLIYSVKHEQDHRPDLLPDELRPTATLPVALPSDRLCCRSTLLALGIGHLMSACGPLAASPVGDPCVAWRLSWPLRE